MPPRIVLDTNQLIAALVRSPQLATFVMAWESRRFTVVASQDLLDEYDSVLGYPKLAVLIYPELLRAFRARLYDEIERVTPPSTPQLCRDPDDDKVLAVAVYGQVNYLLTEDPDLLTPEIRATLAQAGVEIMSAMEFIRRLDVENRS